MSCSCRTFREVKKAPASLYRGFKCHSLVEGLRDRSPRRSDFYPKAQIHKWLSKKRHSRRLPVLAARDLKKSGRQTFVQKLLVESGCRMSQRRDDFAHSFSERSAMAVRLQLPRKKAPNPTDQHVGRRVRMRRMMLSMSQEKLGAALGLTFQQVQKYEKGTNRIGASRLQQMSHIL